MTPIVERLRVARGEQSADLLLRGGRLVNVLTGEIEEVDVAVHEGLVAGVGPGYRAERIVDLDGRYLAPAFIDAHVHIESSMVTPAEFSRAVVPRGTSTVVSDPHEIANVHGIAGIEYMLAASEDLPLTVYVMASSCVPATSMGTAGAALDAQALARLAAHPRVLGLAEVMNFPGVIHGDGSVLAKLAAFEGRPIDGHAPGVRGQALNAYLVGGPRSDHESTTAEEALEKARRGLFVLLREATNARNLRDLIPALTPSNLRRFALCTDDRQPPDLLDEGGIDAMIRVLIEEGLDPVDAIGLGTLNAAQHYGLVDRGAIAPGRRADIVVLSDLEALSIDEVWIEGEQVAAGDGLLPQTVGSIRPPAPSLNVDVASADWSIPAADGEARVIVALPNQIVTGSETTRPTIVQGCAVADPARDLLKIAVLERHSGSGRIGLGFVRGVGLSEGGIAGTVAHDHHNLIVIGADDESMRTAATAVVALDGGLAVARGPDVMASLALPVGGLMSNEPIEEVRLALDRVIREARRLGSALHDPFMAMSFLALEVIPSLKITDLGLVDVERFRLVDLWT